MARKLNSSSAAVTNGCFFCTMKEPDLALRRAGIMNYFRDTVTHNMAIDNDDQELVLVLSGLWSIVMNKTDNEEFPSLGIFEFTTNLLKKCVINHQKDYYYFHHHNKSNVCYIPYYAAHIIGSHTMKSSTLAVKAVESGVIPPLMDLLRGKMTWVEQRVAVRALGHISSYKITFESLSLCEDELVSLAMHLASTCVETVYNNFVGIPDKYKKLKYHRDLLNRGFGIGIRIKNLDLEMDMNLENRKSEEWISQIQCRCLNLLSCFAMKQRLLRLIYKIEFLNELCGMWGCRQGWLTMTSSSSAAGIGLIKRLCYSNVGRRRIAESK